VFFCCVFTQPGSGTAIAAETKILPVEVTKG